MKIKQLIRALPIFLALFFLPSLGWSLDKETPLSERIYVSPEEVEITQDGILFYNESQGDYELSKKYELGYDTNGLYLKPIENPRGPCGIHTGWCRYCKGCGVIYCPMKCECPNGVGGQSP
ncbi:MAG: hypothetical protein H7A38_01350 [Chlamydiales bacterium]|nr:hypothetical protein [Chlamydiales bacterium]